MYQLVHPLREKTFSVRQDFLSISLLGIWLNKGKVKIQFTSCAGGDLHPSLVLSDGHDAQVCWLMTEHLAKVGEPWAGFQESQLQLVRVAV